MLSCLMAFKHVMHDKQGKYKQRTEITMKKTKIHKTMATWRQERLLNREVSKNLQQLG